MTRRPFKFGSAGWSSILYDRHCCFICCTCGLISIRSSIRRTKKSSSIRRTIRKARCGSSKRRSISGKNFCICSDNGKSTSRMCGCKSKNIRNCGCSNIRNFWLRSRGRSGLRFHLRKSNATYDTSGIPTKPFCKTLEMHCISTTQRRDVGVFIQANETCAQCGLFTMTPNELGFFIMTQSGSGGRRRRDIRSSVARPALFLRGRGHGATCNSEWAAADGVT